MSAISRRSFVAGATAWAVAAQLTHAAPGDKPDPAKLEAPQPESWPMFRYGPQQRGLAHSALPEKLELLWTHKAGDKDAMITGTAAIANGRVYVGSLNGTTICIDLKSGKRIWTYRSREAAKPTDFIPGFKSHATVTADTVYIGDEEGLFHAIDRETGKKKWTFETGAEIPSAATPYEDNILLSSHDSNLYCLRAADGTKVWNFATQDRINASPAVSGHHTFVTGCDAHLRVVDIRTGKEISNIDLGSYVIASPAVVDEVLYVGNYGSEVLAIDWKTGKRVWTYTDPARQFPYHSSAAVTDKYVLLGSHDKRLHCIDRAKGAKVWTFQTRGKVNSSPVVVGERVFVGSDDGNLYGLSLQGKELWRHNDGRPFTASPAVGEGCLVIGSESDHGHIYCFGAKG